MERKEKSIVIGEAPRRRENSTTYIKFMDGVKGPQCLLKGKGNTNSSLWRKASRKERGAVLQDGREKEPRFCKLVKE